MLAYTHAFMHQLEFEVSEKEKKTKEKATWQPGCALTALMTARDTRYCKKGKRSLVRSAAFGGEGHEKK